MSLTILLLLIIYVSYNFRIKQFESSADFSQGSYESQLPKGWYGLESNRFRWTGKEAKILLKGPQNLKEKRKCALKISGFANLSYLKKTQLQVTLKVNNQEIGSQPITSDGAYKIQFNFTEKLSDTVTVDIGLDQTFIPNQTDGKGDTRELGIAVRRIVLEVY